MAKNKKAQILAAVMCAATVAGVSPAISSAAGIPGTNATYQEDTNGVLTITNEKGFTFTTDVTGNKPGANSAFTIGNRKLDFDNGKFQVWYDGSVVAANGQIKLQKDGTITADSTNIANGTFKADSKGVEAKVGNNTHMWMYDGALELKNGSKLQVNPDGTTFYSADGSTTTKIDGNKITTGEITADSTNIANGTFKADSKGVEANVGNNTHMWMYDGALELQNGSKLQVNTDGTYFFSADGQADEYTKIDGNTITTGTITADSLNIDSLNINGDLNLQKGKDVTVTTEDGNWYSLTRTGQKVEFIETEDTDGDGVIDTTDINGTKFKDGNMTTDNLVADTATINGNAFVNGEFNANNGQGAIIFTNGDNIYVSTSKGHMNMTEENTVLGYGTSNITLDGNGATFTNGNNGTTTINGGTITTDKLVVGGVDMGSITGTTSEIADKVQGIEHGQYKDPNTGEVTGEYTKVEDVYISGSNINAGGFTVTDGNVNTTGDVVVGGDLTVVGTINGKDITDLATGADVAAAVGDTSKLTTTAKDNVVNAVNEVNDKVGDLKALDGKITDRQEYKDNQSLVGAINAESAMRQQLSGRVDGLESRVDSLEDRMGDVEDRIDKVGAMAAAIANLRTMGYDPEAPTEIAVGVGQYESETGLALGVFHYPNQDFMLSASISTSGDEVMGGIGATWKIGRKSSAEKARSVEEKRVAKAEEMQEMAKAEKVKAQRERHAQMLAEREVAK